MLIWIAIICGIVFLDQLTKWLITVNMAVGDGVEIIEGVIRFKYITNDGMAFGMLDNHRWVFMVASSVAIVGVFVYMCMKHKQADKLLFLALSMFVGGGIGNMIDRVLLGYVIDFVDFYAFGSIWQWVFNVADAFVCIGGVLLIIYFINEIIKDSKSHKKQGENSAADDAIPNEETQIEDSDADSPKTEGDSENVGKTDSDGE